MERRRIEAFRLLGISPDSDRTAVLRAYRRLAHDTHPDVSEHPEAAARFVALVEAYRVASEATPVDSSPDSSPAGAPGVRVRVRVRQDESPDARSDDQDLLAEFPTIVTPGFWPPRWRRPPIVPGPVRVHRANGDGSGNA